jgi:RNA polymerase sigma factor (sigma-70 family)
VALLQFSTRSLPSSVLASRAAGFSGFNKNIFRPAELHLVSGQRHLLVVASQTITASAPQPQRRRVSMSVELEHAASPPNVQLAALYQDDLALAERLQAGDEGAKGEFAARFSPFFHQCASLSGLAREDAEDVAQQALLITYDRLRRGLFQGRSTLETWSYPIIRGQIIEQWDRQRRREHRELQWEETAGHEAAETETAAAELTPHSTWEAFEEWLDVVQALRTLSEQERAILLLNRSERRSVRELGELLELRETEVRRILYAAQEHLRQRLGGYERSFQRRPPTKARPALLPATTTSGESHARDTQPRSTQADAARWLQQFFARCRTWLQRAHRQCAAHGLLFWPRYTG